MDFPASFFDDEVRDGFFVSGQMKRCWASQLEVLSDVDELCKKYDINWFAAYGTLLGAVRHRGFIPWDDDLDIVMLRKDYDRFLEHADELRPVYDIVNQQNNKGEELFIFCTRLTSTLRGEVSGTIDKFHGFPFVTGIDIFCLEDFTDNRKEAKEFVDRYRKLVRANILATIADKDKVNQKNRNEAISFLEKKAGRKFNIEKIGFEIEQYLHNLHRNSFHNPKSKRVIEYQCLFVDTKAIYKRDIFDDWMLLPFENTEIRVPVKYHEFLQTLYGPDYMTPVRGAAVHDYPYYKKQLGEGLEELIEKVWHPYSFWAPDLDRSEKSVRDDARGKSLQFTELLLKIHMMTQRYIELGDITNIGKLLTSCQTVGQNMEQLLTGAYGENNNASELVKEYRRELGDITEEYLQKIVKNKDLDIDKLNRIVVDIAAELENTKEKRQVVFIPYKASQWPALESIWRAAEDDPDCDAYVIPIPYYRKSNLAVPGDQIYEGDIFPSYVPVTDYNTYDFEHRHPDVIYMVSAYDEISCSDCVYPFFYGYNIKKFTDKLVYVPPFEIEEIKPDDKIAIASMEQYVKSPGFVNADYIITQSDNIKDRYMSILEEFSGEEFRGYWDNKLLPAGSPLRDIPSPKVTDLKIYNELADRLSGDKRMIVYQNGAENLFIHPERELEHIREVLRLFEEKKDKITLIWVPQGEIDNNIDSKLTGKHRDAYLKLIDDFKTAGFGIFYPEPSPETAEELTLLASAFYGNPGPLAHLFMMAEKPVMFFGSEK